MIILDTNVISELMRDSPHPIMLTWLNEQPSRALFSTAVNEAEILSGIAVLPEGKRRNRLAVAASHVFEKLFVNRILPFDSSAAIAYAEIASERRASGHPISHFDAQVSAIARSRNAAIATRNTKDFENTGLHVINPWIL
ncbi:MAG: type II toxin-antitoxin system VapC family toxin [Gammaproteobacteria bacterium]|nr:type II toxin-antitoxin system VapC family toxin [Gammaproteobacteria bacterium]